MGKIVTKNPPGYYHYYPVVPAVVLVKNRDKISGLSIAWHTGLSHSPPLIGIAVSPKRYSYALIIKEKEFTVNFLPSKKAFYVAALGRKSGRDMDKIKTFGIETLPSKKIETPIIKHAYAAYECKLQNSIDTGDHILFIGEILAVHYEEKFFLKEGPINIERYEPVLYLGKDIYIKSRKGYYIKKISEKEIDKVLEIYKKFPTPK